MKLGSRYLVVGIWNSLFGITNFYFFSLLFKGAPDLIVLGISYFISIIQAHFSQRKLVWRSTSPYIPELIRFSTAYLLQFALNSALLLLTDRIFEISRELRQTAIVLLLTIIFYFVNKKGVFRATTS